MGFVQSGADNILTTIRGWGVTNNNAIAAYSDVKKIINDMPVSYYLYQNYPNPFNPNTKIRFSIPPSRGARGVTNAKLIIYDVLGRENS